jgi:hypothetical protein
LVYFIYVVFLLMFVFLIWSKKRIDRGEPLFGWRRKQFLKETSGSDEESRYHAQSLQHLLGIRDIKYGIIEKAKNEYAVVLATDFVNYDLLSETGKRSTVAGYEQLYKVLSFPIQIVIQAVRQDSRKDIGRFQQNVKPFGQAVVRFTDGIVQYIRNITWDESRIVKRVYYVVTYRYEPSQNAQIRAEDRLYRTMQELNTRAIQVKNMLKRAQVKSYLLGSLDALEVVRRSINRDRTLAALIDDIEKKEMLSHYVTSIDKENAIEDLSLWFENDGEEGHETSKESA